MGIAPIAAIRLIRTQATLVRLRHDSDPPRLFTTMTNEDLLSRFNTLIMLLTLVTAINNDGHPTLHDHDSTRAQQEDVDRCTRNSILNAVAALLVQDYDIVAIASHGLPKCTQPDEPQQDQGPRVPYPATHEADNLFHATKPNQSSLELTVVANPKNLDDYFDHADSLDKCVMVGRGTSYITIAKSGEWDNIVSLP